MRINQMVWFCLVVLNCFVFTHSTWAQSAAVSETGQQSAVESPAVDLPADQMLQLAVVPAAQEFKQGGKIELDLVLTNLGRGGLKVYKMDEKALYCEFNGISWGAKDSSGDPVVILMPGESARKKLKVDNDFSVGPLKIKCSYGMGTKGVRPADEKVVNIVR